MEQTQATENLSDWFNLSEQTPWETGVYEVESLLSGNVYSYWDGEKFKQINLTKDDAYKGRNHPTYRQQENISWRGLASDPIAKPKPKARGNRKVTRYVVMTSFTSAGYGLPIAVFEDKALADAYVQKEKFMHFYPLEIKNIRFRTPEAD